MQFVAAFRSLKRADAQHYYEELKFARGEPGRLLTPFLTGLRFTDGGTVRV